jgi:hypothetical protein
MIHIKNLESFALMFSNICYDGKDCVEILFDLSFPSKIHDGQR